MDHVSNDCILRKIQAAIGTPDLGQKMELR